MAACFGVIGTILLVQSFAATPYVSIEPETGALLGDVVVPSNANIDPSASNGKYVQFGVPNSKPPPGGYFNVLPAGSFASLPNDTQAAAMVHHSAWEPRPENAVMNNASPPSTYVTVGHSRFLNKAALFGRVTGNYKGTTDEIIQWTAAKWGLSDEIIRAEAIQESQWYQSVKDANGQPVYGQGYGDFNADCQGIGSPPASGYGVNGPSSFGIIQIKWCYSQDWGSANGDWPYIETSTAYNLDLYAAQFRGCLEGWDTWLGNSAGEQPYASNDTWGCVGRWYTGLWHTPDADKYSGWVKNYYDTKPWLAW